MLDTDICMVYTAPSGTTSAASSACCAWLKQRPLQQWGALSVGDNYCGATLTTELLANNGRASEDLCCTLGGTQKAFDDCDDAKDPQGPAFSHVVDFAASEDEWLEAYVAAWKMAQENGWTTLSALSE